MAKRPPKAPVVKYNYQRPDLHPIVMTPSSIKQLSGNEKLAPNMWLSSRQKIGRGGHDYLTVITLKMKGRYYEAKIVTDKKGRIPPEIAAARLLDIEDGDRQGKFRNPVIDFLTNANKQYKPSDLAGTYLWYLHPNESDIDKIDNLNTQIYNIIPAAANSKSPRGIVIVGGSPDQQKMIVDTIKANFTIPEKKLLTRYIFEIARLPRGIAGTHCRAETKGDNPLPGKIQIDPRSMTDGEVVIHEAIHGLRNVDESRPAEVRRTHSVLSSTDRDLEESLTETETVVRQRPFTKHESDTGYYQFLDNKDKHQAIKEDRITTTEPGPKKDWDKAPKKGKVAIKKVQKNYPKTHISKLKVHGGRVEAVDTFFKIRRRAEVGAAATVGVHLHTPKPTDRSAQNTRNVAIKLGPKVTEYRDGKAVTIKNKTKKRRAPGPRMTRNGLISRRKGRRRVPGVVSR